MKKADVQKLSHGLYRIFWKESQGGKSSLAAVGSMHDGQRWIAPVNWTAPIGGNPTGCGKIWQSVEKVELIEAAKYEY